MILNTVEKQIIQDCVNRVAGSYEDMGPSYSQYQCIGIGMRKALTKIDTVPMDGDTRENLLAAVLTDIEIREMFGDKKGITKLLDIERKLKEVEQ